MYEAGFYKLDDETLLHAPNRVTAPGYTLLKEDKDTYTYPFSGWNWYESLEDACDALDLDINNYTEEEDEL